MNAIQNNPKSAQHRMDVHHHIVPREYFLALERAGIDTASFPEWSAEKSLEMMEEQGIAAAITSISSPGVFIRDSSFSRDLAQRCNEYSARLISDYPGRFGALASLPLPDTEGALRELDYALNTLKLDGVMLLSNVKGHYPGESAYEELFAELNRRKAVVLLHPNNVSGSGVSAFAEYPHDVTRAVASLMYSGVLQRYRDIRYILAYAGGTVPYTSYRIIAVGMELGNVAKLVIDYLKRSKALTRMYYDTAATADPYALRALTDHAPISRILYGTNYPWTPEPVLSLLTEELEQYDGFDSESLQSIEYGNMLELFPRLKQ